MVSPISICTKGNVTVGRKGSGQIMRLFPVITLEYSPRISRLNLTIPTVKKKKKTRRQEKRREEKLKT
jgi:hypothetical protein